MLYTPEQTFGALLVLPQEHIEEWVDGSQEVMDGFFLVPAERQGRARTRHQYVRWLTYRQDGPEGHVVEG